MRLTFSMVRSTPARERMYSLSDGHGLHLQVTPYGSKRWRFRYRIDRVEKMISLGLYPKVSLATAR